METGTVYTETVVHSAPEAFLKDAPYQVVIVTLDSSGKRVTGRLAYGSPRLAIGDRVLLAPPSPDGIPRFAPLPAQ